LIHCQKSNSNAVLGNGAGTQTDFCHCEVAKFDVSQNIIGSAKVAHVCPTWDPDEFTIQEEIYPAECE